MHRSAVRVLWFSFLALATTAPVSDLLAGTNVPTPTIVQPPDRFFEEGSVLEVVVRHETSDTPTARRASRNTIELIVDGVLLEERTLRSDATVSTFSIAINPDDPIGLIEVCIGRAGSPSDDRECRRVRAAGPREFDRMRRSLEEMNQIADAVVRYSVMRLGYGRVPQSLDELVPVFLDHVPSASPLTTPYEYTASDVHFALRLALPGSGEIRNDDGAFTRLPRGAMTDRETARVVRQQLADLAQSLESYRVDSNYYPERLGDLAAGFYQTFLHVVDPYGNPYQYARGPDDYVLTGFGRDGLPGGQGFDADSTVTRGMQLIATTPYRGRYEYMRRTFQDMSRIVVALAYFRELNGRWPDALTELVGEAYFAWPRPFTDFCGNPYDYHVYDTGMGRHEYRLRAFGCDGAGTDPLAWMLYYSASDDGYVVSPGWQFSYIWPGVFD